MNVKTLWLGTVTDSYLLCNSLHTSITSNFKYSTNITVKIIEKKT